MLRIRRVKVGQPKPTLRVDYDDAYLALTSLLADAATLEHSLLSVYLYALFSIRDRYASVRGDLSPQSFQLQPPSRHATSNRPPSTSFLDVAIQEMQHLALVNQLLYELRAAPCLERHAFPHRFEIYPFPLELRSLDRYAAATFTWIEAPSAALARSPDNRLVHELERVVNVGSERDVVRDFREVMGLDPIGSLYNQVLKLLDMLRKDPPSFLPRGFAWEEWSNRIDWLRNEGEIDHFHFFRSLFDGEAFGADASIWNDPGLATYPCESLSWRSAYRGKDPGFRMDHPAQPLAWLSNLIYWTLLCLLDLSYRTSNRKRIYAAIEQMASGLWWLGLELAHVYQVGMPFDVVRVRYNLGLDERSTLGVIERLVREARHVAEMPVVSERLPQRFDRMLFDRTLDALRPRT